MHHSQLAKPKVILYIIFFLNWLLSSCLLFVIVFAYIVKGKPVSSPEPLASPPTNQPVSSSVSDTVAFQRPEDSVPAPDSQQQTVKKRSSSVPRALKASPKTGTVSKKLLLQS